MHTQITEQDYSFDYDAIVDQCTIHLSNSAICKQIYDQYLTTCGRHFKVEMLSSDYPDYPKYFLEPFRHLYAEPSNDQEEGVFDFDAALQILEEMLTAHVHTDGNSITLVGSATDYSYMFFEELLEIAVTCSLFPIKQFVVHGNDHDGSDEHWMTIYECHEGKMKSVYCT